MDHDREAKSQIKPRSVFIITRTLHLSAFPFLSSAPTFGYWGLLVTPLLEDELLEAIRSYAYLGAFWEFPAHQEAFMFKFNGFSIKSSEPTITMEFRGKTVMPDDVITQEGRLPSTNADF